MTCHLFDGSLSLFPPSLSAGRFREARRCENRAWRIWIEINCLLQIKDVSLNGPDSARLIYEHGDEPLSLPDSSISANGTFIFRRNMRLHFVLHLC